MSENVHSDTSSDDEVWFGKYTLKEAKRDLNKYIPKKLSRRHTLSLEMSHPPKNSSDPTEISNSNMMMANSPEQNSGSLRGNLDKFNISSNPSEYLTANDSGSTNSQNTSNNLIEKLTRIINEPLSQESSYATACDKTQTVNQTDIDFLKHFEKDTTFDLRNIHQTLVDNTVYLNDNSYLNDTVGNQSEEYEESVIEISDDSSNNLFELIPKKEINTSVESIGSSNNSKLEQNCSQGEMDSVESIGSSNNSKLEQNCSQGEMDHTNSLYQHSDELLESENDNSINSIVSDADQNESELLNNSFQSELTQPTIQTLNSGSVLSTAIPKYDFYNWNLLSKISEKTENTTCATNLKQRDIDILNSVETGSDLSSDTRLSEVMQNKVLGHDSDSKESENLEAFEIPKINLEQFDDSSNFDDTLEEMNRFLNEDIDEPKNISSCTSPKPHVSLIPKFLQGHDTANSVEKQKKFFSADKVTKPKYYNLPGPKTVAKSTNVTVQMKSPMSKKTLFTNTGATPKVRDHNFKVPTKPIKNVLTPNKTTNVFLKNVVSPVSVYINNTPKYAPIVKHSLTQRRFEKQKLTSTKENIPLDIPSDLTKDFPAVIYKPSKSKVITKERDINLPGSIKKLIKESTLTKHNQKIVSNVCNESIERRLMEEEVSIDNSLLANSNQDVSILTIKQALILRK